MRIVLISPYELGRQPFALAQPAAWLGAEGFDVVCLDLSLQKLDPAALEGASMVAVYLGMHTATRIALAALPRIQELAPSAHLCIYGLYAPMNHELFRSRGVTTALGGECEPELLKLAQSLRDGSGVADSGRAVVPLDKIEFRIPDRSGLPSLSQYAHLDLADGSKRIVGFAETTRGCKHLCRHCPVVPVYNGRFRAIPVDVVMADIRQQVAAGAEHISFGDPDFFNGPTHALRVANALHAEFPQLSYDATIKVQHLLEYEHLLPQLKQTGCLFIIAAVESVDDRILEYMDKNHTGEDFDRAVEILRAVDIALAPTFVPFTPWGGLDGYIDLLQRLVDLRLAASVPAVQLTIRLLVPQGSLLMQLPGFADLVDDFDPELLGYPWKHPDPAVDALQKSVQSWVADADQQGLPRHVVFERIWQMAHEATGRTAPDLSDRDLGTPPPSLSEPWYCCAEPTDQQLQSF